MVKDWCSRHSIYPDIRIEGLYGHGLIDVKVKGGLGSDPEIRP